MEGAVGSTLQLLKVSKLTSRFSKHSVLQSYAKYHQGMVPRKDLRIIIGLVSVFTQGFGSDQGVLLSNSVQSAAHRRGLHAQKLPPDSITPTPAAPCRSFSTQSGFEEAVLKAQNRLNILQKK